ncbi:potassium channel protein [Myxococcota bacterium]|nr:potassium channel protein [Myxococcota bacterium]
MADSIFDKMNSIKRRLFTAFVVLIVLVIVGSLGFYLLGLFYMPTVKPGVTWSFLDCLYMMMITVTTTGYGEVLAEMSDPVIRVYTTIMLVFGLVVYVHIVSSMTTFFVEGAFSRINQRRKMLKKINELRNHVIVCGLGSEGVHIVKELMVTKWPLVVVEINKDIVVEQAEELKQYGEVLYIVGDALDEKTLQAAGIERAYGLMSALPADKDNLFVTITARQMNGSLRIVSKAIDLRTSERMKIAGADSVVSTSFIGGMRMASEMIRPQVVDFIDIMLRDKSKNLRLEELTISTGSKLGGTPLGDAGIATEGELLVLAIKNPHDGSYLYGPSSDFRLETGLILVVMGEPNAVAALRKRVSGMTIAE